MHMPHTFEQEKEMVTLIITLIGTQAATIIVAAIHAWLAHTRYKATRDSHERIETEVKKLNGNGGGDH